MLHLPSPSLTRKPGPQQIARTPAQCAPSSSWVWRDLVWGVLPGGPAQREVLANGLGTLRSASNQWTRTTRLGIAARADFASGESGFYWPWSAKIGAITTQFTIVAVAMPLRADTDLDGHNYKFLCIPYRSTGWTSPWTALSFGVRNTATREFNVGFATNSSTLSSVDSDANGVAAYGEGPLVYGVTRNGTTAKFYRNGAQHGASKTVSSAAVDWTNTQPPVIGGNTSSATNGNEDFDCIFHLVLLSSREWTAAEMARFAADPFAAFTRASRRLFVDAAGGAPPAGGGFRSRIAGGFIMAA